MRCFRCRLLASLDCNRHQQVKRVEGYFSHWHGACHPWSLIVYLRHT